MNNDPITLQVIDQRRDGGTASAVSINILICTNALFQQHAAVCLASLLANNPDFFSVL